MLKVNVKDHTQNLVKLFSLNKGDVFRFQDRFRIQNIMIKVTSGSTSYGFVLTPDKRYSYGDLVELSGCYGDDVIVYNGEINLSLAQ